MTPALKTMVEAMDAEIDRQEAEFDDLRPRERGEYMMVGLLDVEKIARAGLAAIREPDTGMLDGAEEADVAADPHIGTEFEGCPADPADAADHWRFMIDAILKEPTP